MTQTERKREESIEERTARIIEKWTAKPENCQLDFQVSFLDTGDLSPEEMGRAVGIGDRRAESFQFLVDHIYKNRGKTVKRDGVEVDATEDFFQTFALSARSGKEIPHTSLLEQLRVTPDVKKSSPPMVFEGLSTLVALGILGAEQYWAFEIQSSRGTIFPRGAAKVPGELRQTPVGERLVYLNSQVENIYHELVKRGLEWYLKTESRTEGETREKYEFRVLSFALDDARQVTNNTFVLHGAMNPNNALALRETVVRLHTSNLPEVQELASRLEEISKAVLPTIMRHTKPSDYALSLNTKRDRIYEELGLNSWETNYFDIERKPEFRGELDSPEEAERKFLAAFLASGKKANVGRIMVRLRKVSDKKIGEFISQVFDGIGLHDKPARELGLIHFTAYDVLMSVGAMYDMARHRRATQIFGEQSPDNGFVVPNSYKKNGLEGLYKSGIQITQEAYANVLGLGKKYREYAPYFVARGHLVNCTIELDGLDVFHIVKLRGEGGGSHDDVVRAITELEKALRQAHAPIFRHLVKKN